jgi:arogenate/prephenate dehydratase
VQIASQGEPGAYSEAAARRLRPDASTRPLPTFEQVFDAVADGRVSHGILPIENSIAGSIHRNYDLLLDRQLPIVAEVTLPIVHHLLALPGVQQEDIRRVYSHPQALAQCERFLRGMTGVEIVATYDTAGSAKMVQDGGLRDAAAIASARAAEVFGLATLHAGIQDFDDNLTRFVVVARHNEPLGAPTKTSIVFALPNRPGSLFKALSVFALREIDLTKLESRPLAGRPWEYLFYVDLAIAREAPTCVRSLMHLSEFAMWVRTLGTYPAWLGGGPQADPAGSGPQADAQGSGQ